MGRGELERLSKEELIELVLRLQRPEKTSRLSSKPPSTDRKEQREKSKPGGAKPGHEGHSRVMSEAPDAVIEHRPGQCSGCGVALSADLLAETVSVLARDIADAVEASDDPAPWRLQIWLNAVFALAGRVTNLAASTLAAKRRTLDRHLAGILTTASCCDPVRYSRCCTAQFGCERFRSL